MTVAICQRYSISSIHYDYESLLHDAYHSVTSTSQGNSSSSFNLASDDSLEATEESYGILTVLVELNRMLMDAVRRTNKNFDDVYRMFSRWDVGGTGTVTATQFLRVLAHLHINFSEQDQDLLVELFDTEGEGRVDFDSLISYCLTQDENLAPSNQHHPQPSEPSPYVKSYFGDDQTHTTSNDNNSALSIGSGGSGELIHIKPPMSTPQKPSLRSQTELPVAASEITGSQSFQGGRVRPRTATGGESRNNQSDPLRNGRFQEFTGDSLGDKSEPLIIMEGSSYNLMGLQIESPSSIKRVNRMTRPLTAAPRIPDTVSVPRHLNSQLREDAAIDEFVVDVLSDDDVIDDDNPVHANQLLQGERPGNNKAQSNSQLQLNSGSGNNKNDRHISFPVEQSSPPSNDNDEPKLVIITKEMVDRQLFMDAAAAAFSNVDHHDKVVDKKSSNQVFENQKSAHGSQTSAQYESMRETRTQPSTEKPTVESVLPQVYISSQKQAPYTAPLFEAPVVVERNNLSHQHAHISRPVQSIQPQVYSSPYTPGPAPSSDLQADHRRTVTNNTNLSPAAMTLKMLRREIIHRHQHSGKTLLEIFRQFDLIGNRYFDAKDLQRVSMELSMHCDMQQSSDMLRLLALDGEDRVSFSEFAVFITVSCNIPL